METEELTTTPQIEQSDNSETTVQEPDSIPNEAVKISEPANEENEQSKNQKTQDFQEVVPKKFLDKDGNVNIKELAKSYKSIEHLVGEKAQWTKEKEGLLKQLNNTIKPSKSDLYQQAQSYMKFINEAKDTPLVEELLKEFKQNPSEELLSRIEENFAPKIIKQAALECANSQEELKKKVFNDNIKNEKQEVQKFIEANVNKHPDYFGNPAFNNLFKEAVELVGTNFDTDILIGLMDDYANSKLYEFLIKIQNGKQNQNAVSEISKITPSSKTKKIDDLPPADLLKIDDTELLKKYIQKYSKK